MKHPEKYLTVIIEPSEIIREGIKLFLEANPKFEVMASFPDLQAFEDKVIKKEIRIIFINPAMINFYKPFNIRDLFSDYPDAILIAILYQYTDAETIQSFDGVLDIYDEGWLIPRKILKIIETAQPPNDQLIENVELSEREKEVLVAVAKGLMNKEIADKLNLSIHTVIAHRKNIVRKTGIKTISGLTLYALFNNIISQEELL